jgi:hypothetical protein
MASGRQVAGVPSGKENEKAAGEHGEGPHPEKNGVKANLCGFGGDEALTGDDEASRG